ncbi:hypothetical protein HDE69_005242 [Pedobacter cryoconitis]|uniref:Uncharacterized protein n=1 Tax=Pedobacter cryoconitis TaxID=188932 RepID=A0A7W9DND9_9SPHI|nr:hypothetical protein [Pedobacter cryoconitis]
MKIRFPPTKSLSKLKWKISPILFERLIKLWFKLDKIIIILIKTSHLQVKIYYIFL